MGMIMKSTKGVGDNSLSLSLSTLTPTPSVYLKPRWLQRMVSNRSRWSHRKMNDCEQAHYSINLFLCSTVVWICHFIVFTFIIIQCVMYVWTPLLKESIHLLCPVKTRKTRLPKNTSCCKKKNNKKNKINAREKTKKGAVSPLFFLPQCPIFGPCSTTWVWRGKG